MSTSQGWWKFFWWCYYRITPSIPYGRKRTGIYEIRTKNHQKRRKFDEHATLIIRRRSDGLCRSPFFLSSGNCKINTPRLHNLIHLRLARIEKNSQITFLQGSTTVLLDKPVISRYFLNPTIDFRRFDRISYQLHLHFPRKGEWKAQGKNNQQHTDSSDTWQDRKIDSLTFDMNVNYNVAIVASVGVTQMNACKM